jgi:hypothetical protein
MIINQEAKTTPNAFGSLSMGEMKAGVGTSAGKFNVNATSTIAKEAQYHSWNIGPISLAAYSSQTAGQVESFAIEYN